MHAQVIPSQLLLWFVVVCAEYPLDPADAAFHGVERGVAIVACLVAGFADEVGLGVCPPAESAVSACGDPGEAGDGCLGDECERDLFAGCAMTSMMRITREKGIYSCWRGTWKRRDRGARW